MLEVPVIAIVGCGTDKTRIPELALGTVLLLPSVQVIEVQVQVGGGQVLGTPWY
jgi:hypothetical protein